jgi:alkaline phosphatase D
MPIANNRRNTEIYRSFDFGGLVDLYMLETRLSARDEPVGNNQQGGGEAIDTLDWQREDRTMLGESQKDWLINGLTGSDAKWKIIGSSIMMTHLPVNFLLNYDAWDGFPAERQDIFDAIRANNIENVGVFSGDVHMSFAANLMDDNSDRIEAYDSMGGIGSIGFEFTTPSVTSSNLNELPEITLPFFGTINPLGDRLEERSELAVLIEGIVRSSVPWVNHYNSDQHGYYLFYANDDFVQGDWMYVGSVLEQDSRESLGRSLRVNSGNNTLITVNQSIPTLAETVPAPETIKVNVEKEEDESAIVIGTYPNPAKGKTYLNLALNGNTNVSVEINDLAGRKLNAIDYGQRAAGNISLPFDIEGYPNGNYILKIIIGDKVYSRRISIQN